MTVFLFYHYVDRFHQYITWPLYAHIRFTYQHCRIVRFFLSLATTNCSLFLPGMVGVRWLADVFAGPSQLLLLILLLNISRNLFGSARVQEVQVHLAADWGRAGGRVLCQHGAAAVATAGIVREVSSSLQATSSVAFVSAKPRRTTPASSASV